MKFKITMTILFLIFLGIVVYVVDPSMFSGGTASHSSSNDF